MKTMKTMKNPFTRWLVERGYWDARKGGGKGGRTTTDEGTNNEVEEGGRGGETSYTHVFLDGGKAVVPSSAIDSANQVYSDAILSGHTQYAVECAPKDRMKMFVDVDTKNLPPLPLCSGRPDHISSSASPPSSSLNTVNTATASSRSRITLENIEKRVAEIILDSGRAVCPELESADALVCTKVEEEKKDEKEEKDGGNEGKTKGGIHIVWQGDTAVIDRHRASTMRDEIVAGCIRRASFLPLTRDGSSSSSLSEEGWKEKEWWKSVNWNDLIDSAVYRTASLRMIFARKRDSNAVYAPAMVYHPSTNHTGEREREKKSSEGKGKEMSVFPGTLCAIPSDVLATDMLKWVRMASIHPPPIPPHPLPVPGPTTDDNGVIRREQKRGGIAHDLLTSGDVETDKIEELRTALPEPYRSSCTITAVRKNASKGTYIINTNSRFCMKKGSEHRSNHVYFVAKDDGVYLRCFSCGDLNQRVCDTHPLPCLKDAARRSKEDAMERKLSTVPTPLTCADVWLKKLDAASVSALRGPKTSNGSRTSKTDEAARTRKRDGKKEKNEEENGKKSGKPRKLMKRENSENEKNEEDERKPLMCPAKKKSRR